MNYHNITYPDMNNGDGLRVVLWLSGCSHQCKDCQNPQTWDINSGIPFDEAAKEELFKELDKDYISGLTLSGGDPLFESNLDEVLNLVNEINKRYNKANKEETYIEENHNDCHDNPYSKHQKSIWLYTGYQFETIFRCYRNGEYVGFPHYDKSYPDKNTIKRQDIIRHCDVLVDGRYINTKRDVTLKWCGSSNQKVIDIQKTLKEGKVSLWDV